MIILASKSPRRKDMLNMLGVEYICAPADTDETVVEGMTPQQAVCEFSLRKALAVADKAKQEDVVLGMDTMVYSNGTLLGKPADKNDAYRMLKLLSGSRHTVYTGYTVIYGNETVTDYVATDVYFLPLTDDDINGYIATGEPMDKAGAYGIQGKGSLFIERISGDYFSVLGFPVSAVFSTVKKLTGKSIY